MGQRRYNKNEIVELVSVQLRGEIIDHSERYKSDIKLLEELEVYDENKDIFGKFEKRFTNVVSFLLKPDVRQQLGDPRGYEKSKQYFFSKQMSITRSTNLKGKNNAYQLNLIDALFMTSLMLTYNHPSFIALRNSKTSILKPETLMNDWAKVFARLLEILCHVMKEDIEKDISLPSTEIIEVNLMSLFWQLSPLMEKYNHGIYGDLAGIAAAFQALPEEKREYFYTEKLEKPLNDIKEDLLDFIKDIESDEDKSNYYEFIHNFHLEYNAYELLNELPDELSMSDLTNLLKNKFNDSGNEMNEDKKK